MKPYRTLGPAAAAHNRWCRECRRHRARSRRAGAAAWRRDDGAGWAGGSSARNVEAATSIFHGQRGKSRLDVMLRFTPEAAEDAERWMFHPTQSLMHEPDPSRTVRWRAP